MTKGLSKQQKRILIMLETKKIPRDDRGYFSTQEVLKELYWEYFLWLKEVEHNPWFSNRKTHIDYQKYDKLRVSVYRALRSLEKRGLVVSFHHGQSRWWAVPERLKEVDLGTTTFHERDWVERDKERRKERRIKWKWGAFIRTLPLDLRVRYNLRIVTEQELQEIKHLWEKHQKNSNFEKT